MTNNVDPKEYQRFLDTIQNGNEELVRTYASEHPEFVAHKHDSQNVFHVAAQKGDANILQVLMDSVTDSEKLKDLINAEDSSGRSATDWASQLGHNHCLELLNSKLSDATQIINNIYMRYNICPRSSQIRGK